MQLEDNSNLVRNSLAAHYFDHVQLTAQHDPLLMREARSISKWYACVIVLGALGLALYAVVGY